MFVNIDIRIIYIYIYMYNLRQLHHELCIYIYKVR